MLRYSFNSNYMSYLYLETVKYNNGPLTEQFTASLKDLPQSVFVTLIKSCRL